MRGTVDERQRKCGRRLPSADRLRHFLYAFHDEQLIPAAQAARPAGQGPCIPAENAALQALARVNTAPVHRVAAQGRSTTATLDHDATIQESHKREALPHYQGGRGYQPTAVYWGEQDLVVADEYRDGNVGAGMETLPLIRRAFASPPPTVTTFTRAGRLVTHAGQLVLRVRAAGKRLAGLIAARLRLALVAQALPAG
jgi:hypothetical protein